MRKVFTIAMLLLAFGVYAQDTIRVDAESSVAYMMRQTKEKVHEYMRGAIHEEVDSLSDIYYIYSRRENKNIPVQFYYVDFRGDGKLRVWKAEFISRKSKYKTVDLKTAFWIEYIKDVTKE